MWGKDHWSTFAYLETKCVNDPKGLGKPNPLQIQTNHNRHPHMGNHHDGSGHSIRLKGGVELPGSDYDEWDCLDDAERLCLIENVGSGINRLYKFTEFGMKIAGQLRAHKMRGGNFADFQPNLAEVQNALEERF